MTPARYDDDVRISSPQDIHRLVEQARSGGRFGVDTEFLREKTYRPKLCLVQVATNEEIFLIDPLAGHDVSPIADLVQDPEVEVVVHAGRQDFEIFSDRFDATPRRVFDVQIAAGFAGLGASLPYGRLVESITKKTLQKGESYSDWCKRPLTASQLRYAADDVRFLLVIADRLKDELTRDGRLRWAEDEMRQLEDADLYRVASEDAYRKVSGRGTLNGKQAGVLRALAAWREDVAIQRDIPRGWVVKDQSLVEAARKAPGSVGDLKAIRGFPAREAERSGRAILDAIQQGLAAGPMEVPRGPSRSAQQRARTLSGLADAIIRSRAEAAGVASELVANRSELESLLADIFGGGADPAAHRLLQGWRRDIAGDAVVALAEGRIAVRSTERPPYIEEVPL